MFALQRSVTLLLVLTGSAQADPVAEPLPPPSTTSVIGEVVGGALTSVAGGFAGLLVADKLCQPNHDDECLDEVVFGMYIGGGLTFGVGVYLVGSLGAQTGSFGATMLGGALGVGVGTLAVVAFDRAGADNLIPGLTVAMLTPVIGALVGFHTSRRWKTGHAPRLGSLIHVDDGQLSFGVPLVTQDVRGTSMSLFSGRF